MSRCAVKIVLFVSTLLIGLGPVAAAPGPAFGPLVTDPPPKRTTRSNHYVVSNEDRHDLFRAAITDLGGVMVGVGADQLYLMAGWVKPQVLVPMDFDQYVVDLHGIYRIAFLNAKTPTDFIAFFKPANKGKLDALIQKAISDPVLAARYIKVLNFSRKTITWRLRRVVKHYTRLKIPIFLTSQPVYDFIVSLHREGRVHPVRGDLTKDKTMASIAAAARKANLPIRVLYLSNAEQYFTFKAQYRKNILGLPFDAKSVAIRTFPISKTSYRYYIQPGSMFHQWMRSYAINNVRYMVQYRTAIPNTKGRAYLLNRPPPKRKGR